MAFDPPASGEPDRAHREDPGYPAAPGQAIIDREEYLRHVQGMTFGEDPAGGLLRGEQSSTTRTCASSCRFPDGWKKQNMPQAVVALSPTEDAIIQLGLAGKDSPQQAARQFLSQQGVQAGNASTRSINGLPAASSYFQAQTNKADPGAGLVLSRSAVSTFGLMGYTPSRKARPRMTGFSSSTIRSFSELRDHSKINVQPARVEVVKVPRQMTLEQFNSQYPSSIPIEELAIINELESSESVISAGQPLKRVVGEGGKDHPEALEHLVPHGAGKPPRSPRSRPAPSPPQRRPKSCKSCRTCSSPPARPMRSARCSRTRRSTKPR